MFYSMTNILEYSPRNRNYIKNIKITLKICRAQNQHNRHFIIYLRHSKHNKVGIKDSQEMITRKTQIETLFRILFMKREQHSFKRRCKVINGTIWEAFRIVKFLELGASRVRELVRYFYSEEY